MIKILLLEDDKLFASTLIDYLEESGYLLTHVTNGNMFLSYAYEKNFDIYLLDINVPKINGLDSLKEIRHFNNTPAIFITSHKDKATLKECFLSGADDFLRKPFELDELYLRIQSILKRSGKISNVVTIDDIKYNPKLNTISKNDQDINLGAKPIELFKLFYENNHQIVTKDMIIKRLWKYDENYSEGSIRVYITKIQKLFNSKKITNIKNIGYKIEF